jgi:hypothetical protein
LQLNAFWFARENDRMTLYCFTPTVSARAHPIGEALRKIAFPLDNRTPKTLEQVLEKLGMPDGGPAPH